jgi:hypothetical protein
MITALRKSTCTVRAVSLFFAVVINEALAFQFALIAKNGMKITCRGGKNKRAFSQGRAAEMEKEENLFNL